jgi:alpha-tubulin suppressor-like RCC1 family protein
VLGDTTFAQATSALDSLTNIGISGLLAPSDPMYYSFGCGLDAANQLVCFGDNQLGQFGNGQYDGLTCGNLVCDHGEIPAYCPNDCGGGPLVPLARTYTALGVSWPRISMSTGYARNISPYACGVRPDSQIECWGYASRGGAGPDAYHYDPVVMQGISGCTAVKPGSTHTCALCGGDVYCWGDHRFGAVGAGPITRTGITTPRKVDIALDEPFVQLVSGVGFSCARTQSGRAYCWGFSRDGALGSGGATSPLPVIVQRAP